MNLWSQFVKAAQTQRDELIHKLFDPQIWFETHKYIFISEEESQILWQFQAVPPRDEMILQALQQVRVQIGEFEENTTFDWAIWISVMADSVKAFRFPFLVASILTIAELVHARPPKEECRQFCSPTIFEMNCSRLMSEPESFFALLGLNCHKNLISKSMQSAPKIELLSLNFEFLDSLDQLPQKFDLYGLLG